VVKQDIPNKMNHTNCSGLWCSNPFKKNKKENT
jgi:hypothetical protein